MPAVKTKRISTLIESQLPEFITTEYELFSKFVQKYYEAQEVQGGTLDIINNIQKYADIDYYEKNLLKQNDILSAAISPTDTDITLSDAQSFPTKNGYVRIGDEIIFYETRTDTVLQGCSRGVSGNTTLGDLYDSSNFVSTNAAAHAAGSTVHNVSNLFLYALVKNFENQYLGSFPEKYLKGDIDKRTLIKNIQKFYKAKGTTSSIKFVFNTIVAKDIDNKPEVYNPKDFTYKSSESDWINIYALKVKVVSGDPKSLIGKKIVQALTDEYPYADATVDNVYPDGTSDNEVIWNIVLAPETVNGVFNVSTKTRLESTFAGSLGTGGRINVASTLGWEELGSILIDEEVIEFDDKNVTQFIIKNRGDSPVEHTQGTPVYRPVIIEGSDVRLLTLGVVYNAVPDTKQPYSFTGDKLQISNPGFESADPRIVKTGTNDPRWILGSGASVSAATNSAVESALAGVSTNVSAIFADEQYYYITSSSYPSYNIFDGTDVSETMLDQKLLKIVRKTPTTTTEIYKTPKRDVGILLNGVPIYGYKDSESVRFGALQEIKVSARGRNYAKPPFVLIDDVPNKARAFLTGNVVDRIEVNTSDTFLTTPNVEITSGKGGKGTAVVTGGEVTSIVIDDPGRYYSSPPRVIIRDKVGRGRFAEYTTTVDTDGKITEFNKVAGGTLYTQQNIEVEVIPVGEGATATPFLREWNLNRFEKLKLNLDTQFGHYFENYNNVLEYGYAQVANPKALRLALNDNIDGAGTEPANKTHSPIIGFAYDGNPIYGPFGHRDPLDDNSPIVRMTSSYTLNQDRAGGPALVNYPLGSFVDDYKYTHKSGSLDENNGRFCITPDFPTGTYAYFLTINSDQVPQFPYVLGDKYYSLPVDSNYNSNINQNDVPRNAKRFYRPGMQGNGEGLIAQIEAVTAGTVDRIAVDRSSTNFSINSKLFFDNEGTEGSGVEALVASVKGEEVNYLQSREDKVVKLTTIQNAYLFQDDTLRQPASGASGSIVGTVTDDNTIVLKNVNGTFNNTGTFSADIKTFLITVDQDSNYTKGATLSLTDGVNPPIATAEILEGTSKQNTVKIKQLTGTWIVDDDYFLQSSNLFNTSGSKIVTLVSLSDNLEPFEVNQSVALVETTENHGLAIGDEVNISIFPDDATKTKNYSIRKRLYQTATFAIPQNNSTIDYDGVGRFTILNGGADYTAGSYTDVPLTGGSGTGATASITVSSAGVVSSIQIETGGTGYRRGDFLAVDDDELGRSGASLSSARFTLYVDHAGVSLTSSNLPVRSALGFAEGDFLSVGSEVMQVLDINGDILVVSRGQEGTTARDHYDGSEVSLYKPNYNFITNFPITGGVGTGYIDNYDAATQTATIVFDYSTEERTAQEITNSTTFFDSSEPKRLVVVNSAGPVGYKFEFSDDGVNYTPNPTLNIQEYYKYVFDTSHASLTGTYFDLSPSKSFNLITQEKTTSIILPGNPGAFTEVKFGFGSRLAQNNYDTKTGTNFLNFYYFDKNGIVDSDGAFFRIIDDPLQGNKVLNYVTADRFVYDIPSSPLWDGSGTINYTTSGQFAVGEINSVKIVNLGENYKKVPLVVGVEPTFNDRGTATVLFDSATKTIQSVRIDTVGSNYVNPKVVVLDADGTGAIFKVVQQEGRLFSITVENPGKGYTYAPVIQVIESDTELYGESDAIGTPQSVRIIDNGGAYHLDKTVASDVTSKYTVSLRNFSGQFQRGEIITQTINGTEVLRAKVAEYRNGSNLVKLESTVGIIRENVALVGSVSGATGTVKGVFVSTFQTDISSFFDNLGYYTSDKGRLGVANQKLTDSFFYQDYSYVVKSKTSIEQWRDLIKATTHPAGFKLFGQVDVEATANTEMPSTANEADTFSIIQLWDPNKNQITVESTKQVTTQTIQVVENTRIRKGQGSAATSEFNFNETRAFEFTLDAPFDGYYDEDGRLQGTKVFKLKDYLGNQFIPVNAESIVVTLDGIIQEPEVAYRVNYDTIVFTAPPLGDGAKLTGNNLGNLTSYKGMKFIGRSFYFKDAQYNTRYLRKLKNIYQRNGRWIDAANQIERNKQFIIEESVGYGQADYSNLDWSTKLDDYQTDIGYILDSYSHDLRFGGNTKVVDYAKIFESGSAYITENKTESLDIFKYATNLAKLAIRNWDFTELNVTYIQGSKRVTVSDTDNLVIGMHISSGRAFDPDTKIVSIDNATTVTLNKAALSNSGGAGGASAETTFLTGSTGGNDLGLATSVGAVRPGSTFEVEPGDDLIVPLSFSGIDSATFYLSGINNGTFYDASNLIAGNKEFFQEEISGFVYANYNLNGENRAKCYRDLGFLVDNIVYHLRFGGNERVVNFAQLYYTNRGYPYGEELTSINRSAEETAASIAAWDRLGLLMTQAMRNTLGAGDYTEIEPFTDTSIAVDTQFPYCQEVESAIGTYIGIVKDILERGTGVVEVTKQNSNKPGNWTTTLTYSNYNIIADPLLTAEECNDVISSMNSLYSNLDDILNSTDVERNLPDFIDGETKEFEMFWDDGSPVTTEKDENLLITINAVLQETKFNANYPGDDSYYIDRTVVPNKLVFDVAPIWDQYEGAKTLGEPTAVEKVIGIGIGNYKRLTIDKNLVNNVRSGPFLILDLEDLTVQNIEENSYLLVFVDGVLQKEGTSYTVSGPNIFFTFPVTEQMKVDMRYLYGRDVGQVLNLYDYNVDQYYANSRVVLNTTSGLADFDLRAWMGNQIGQPIHAFQIRPDGTYNVIGQISDPRSSGSVLEFDCFGYKAEFIENIPMTFAVKGRYSLNTEVGFTLTGSSITYERDEDNNILLRGIDQNWRGTYWRKTYKNPFVSISNGSLIRVEGEEGFRRVNELPSILTAKEQRPGEQSSNSFYGQVSVAPYSGITRGEGLSIVAIVENGSVVRLDWNKRSYDPITQPTAYQYYTPPVVNFLSEDGNGGGARAQVLVSKGQVVSVELIDGGNGYTKAPKVVVSRRYDVLEESDIGVSLIDVRMNLEQSMGLNIISTIDVISNQAASIETITSTLIDSPLGLERQITCEVYPAVLEPSTDLTGALDEILTQQHTEEQVAPIDTFYEATVISGVLETRYIENIASESTLSTKADRFITMNLQRVIENDYISNVNYFASGSFLQAPLSPTDTIVYVADTSKFKTNGYLLIGGEIVRYLQKLNDRFLKVERGLDNTSAQSWNAGTFIRQVPDPVSVSFAGVSMVESESSIVTLNAGAKVFAGGQSQKQVITPKPDVKTVTKQIVTELAPAARINTISTVETFVRYRLEPPAQNVQSFSTVHLDTKIVNTIQMVHSEFTMQRENLEMLITPPPGGAVDGYQESVFISDPINTRLNGFVDLLDTYEVVKRDGTSIFARNAVFGAIAEYVGNYERTNAGHTIGHFDGIFDDGAAGVSGLSLYELDLYFPALTLGDFEKRAKSSYTVAGDKFNLLPPSIQNPVTFSNSQGSIGGPIVVQDTTYFPDAGFLYHSVKGIPSATGTTLGQKRFGTGGNVNLETNTDPRFGDTCVFLNEDGGLSNGGEYLSAAQPLGTGNFTVQFWFKPGTDPGFPNYSNLIYYGSSSITGVGFGSNQNQPDIGWSIQMNNTDTATPLLSLWNGETQGVTTCGTCNRGSWNHIAIERKDGVMKVYVNGGERTSVANTQEYNNGTMGGNNSNPFLAIGYDNGTIYDPFHGHIDNVHVQSAATYNGMPVTYGQPDQYTLLLENFDTPSTTYSGVIQYTSKTATSFEGCTLVNGDNVISNGSEIVPFTK